MNFLCATKKVLQNRSAKVHLKVPVKSCDEIDDNVMKFHLTIYINFDLYRFLCQKASSLFQDPRFSIIFVQQNLPCVFAMVQFQSHLLGVSFRCWAVTVLYQSRVYRGVNFFQNAEYFGLQFIILDTTSNAWHNFQTFSPGILLIHKTFCSTLISLSDSLELTFLDIFRSVSNLVNLVLSSSKLFFKSSRMCFCFFDW